MNTFIRIAANTARESMKTLKEKQTFPNYFKNMLYNYNDFYSGF